MLYSSEPTGRTTAHLRESRIGVPNEHMPAVGAMRTTRHVIAILVLTGCLAASAQAAASASGPGMIRL